MGRGLSPLQRRILKLAERTGTLHIHQVLSALYGFPMARHGRPGALHFRPGAIGRRRYHSASVAVGRAFTRLANRGLVARVIGGIELID